jgi:hypothetical protein
VPVHIREFEDRDRPSLSSKGVWRSETVRFRYRGADRKDDRSPAGQFSAADLALRDGRPDNRIGFADKSVRSAEDICATRLGPDALHEPGAYDARKPDAGRRRILPGQQSLSQDMTSQRQNK